VVLIGIGALILLIDGVRGIRRAFGARCISMTSGLFPRRVGQPGLAVLVWAEIAELPSGALAHPYYRAYVLPLQALIERRVLQR
jgi:hypothetical protein